MRVRYLRASAVVAGTAALVAGTALAPVVVGSASAATVRGDGHHGSQIKHVLLLSVDGLHQQDLAWYVKNYPTSTLASLVNHGIDYSNARTPIPSDSFPGMVAQVTGGDPGVTGIYYDDTYNHDVFPAGTTNCSGPVPGGEAAYEEADDDQLQRAGRRPGADRAARQHPADDQQPGAGDQPGQPAGQPEDLQAHLPEPVLAGQHHLQRRPRRMAW